ncbi:MAG: gliding motility-associated ABC transporter substrate-binding protein GldG [Edaphocola sp.]
MAANAPNNILKKKQQPLRKLLALIAGAILVNVLGWFFYAQLDLTADKRFTITEATRSMLHKLDTKVEVLVFLDGDNLPAAFQQLSNSTDNILRSFRDMSGNKVSYRFVDPLGDDSTVIALLKEYNMTGIPVTINAGKKGTEQKMIFPWALATATQPDGKRAGYPVFLQETNTFNLNRQTLLKSEMLLEYNLANGIHQLTRKEIPAVAYLLGNGEVFDGRIAALFATLQRFYRIDTLNIDQVNVIPGQYKTVFVNGPTVPFTDLQQYKLDQYVMNGGRLYWSLNMVTGTLDSLRSGHFNAMPIDLNLGNLLYNYGLRVNTNLIKDAVNHAYIPLEAKTGKAEATMFPWVYFPVLNPGSDHPIVKNMNGVLCRFVGSIDTNSNDAGIKKTILLASSRYSNLEATPTPILLASAIEPVEPATFRKSYLPAAVLLEGSFNSAYATRRPLALAEAIGALHLPFKEKSAANGKMIVTADADMMLNEFSENKGPSDMGVFAPDPSTGYDNKNFLLNSMEYLNDADNLLEARGKVYDNRILDPKVVEKERSTWQFVNIAVPAALVTMFGAVFFFVRKKRYG